MFSIVVVLMYLPTNIAEDLLFFIYWWMIISFLFDDGHSDRGKVISHCGFDVQFPDSDFEHLFMYLLAIYIASSVCVFFCFVAFELKFELCIYSGYKPLIRYKICKYFLPFHFVDGFLCYAKVYLDVYCFFFWCQIQKIIAKTFAKEITTYILFYDFYGLRYYINPFWINFCVVKDSGWVSFFFCMWLFSFFQCHLLK